MDSIQAQCTASVSSSDVSQPAWAERMRRDYRQTGAYRAEDLHRLIGDTTQAVSSRRIISNALPTTGTA